MIEIGLKLISGGLLAALLSGVFLNDIKHHEMTGRIFVGAVWALFSIGALGSGAFILGLFVVLLA